MPATSPPEGQPQLEHRLLRSWVWLPLAHHRREDLDRCLLLPLGHHRLALCARCLALYPVLFALLVLQALLRPPSLGRLDWLLVMAASGPAALDWGLAWIRCRRGSPASRMLSGALLGLALGRSFWLYFHDPLSELFWAQLLLLAAVAVIFEILRQLRRWQV